MNQQIMKPAKTIKVKLTSKTPRERKHPDGAANQIAARNAAPKEGDIVAHFLPITGDDLKETIKEVSEKLKPAKSAPAKSNKADKAVTKAKRVFKKAGCPDPTDAEVKTYLAKLLATYPQSPFSGPAHCCDVTDLYQAFSQRTGPGRLWISLDAGLLSTFN